MISTFPNISPKFRNIINVLSRQRAKCLTEDVDSMWMSERTTTNTACFLCTASAASSSFHRVRRSGGQGVRAPPDEEMLHGETVQMT